jgi:type VI secretion system lysozyme-like protein
LDRLTDDDPVNRSLNQTRGQIKQLEKQLTLLKKNADLKKPDKFRKERDLLAKQLDVQRQEYARLLDSMTSLREIRQCVKRDLDWLLNSHNFKPQSDLDEYPEIQTSILNFGLPDLAGITASSIDRRGMEKLLKQVLLNFEPRIIRRSLRVRLLAEGSIMDHNTLRFEIEGDLIAEPFPIHLHLLTQLELENGDMIIQDFEQNR